MAFLYHTSTARIHNESVDIRPLEGEDHHVAFTFQGDEEDEVTEMLLTREEVQQAYDLLFNR